MPYVDSTAISRIEYDDRTQRMQIWFRGSGGPYDFCNVPRHIYESFLHARSIGEYYNDYIRGRYSC
ncbi:MAG: KTSC domain-containing protein [Rhodospirillaceae bacterium]|nr:KTSC domain-containing protein [Rhodospirillaceae bacterium]